MRQVTLAYKSYDSVENTIKELIFWSVCSCLRLLHGHILPGMTCLVSFLLRRASCFIRHGHLQLTAAQRTAGGQYGVAPKGSLEEPDAMFKLWLLV